jgi:intracellular sulfur oxidation DsrE/DsrF family protein
MRTIRKLAIGVVGGLAVFLLLDPAAKAGPDHQVQAHENKLVSNETQSNRERLASRPRHTNKTEHTGKSSLALVTKPAETDTKSHQLVLQVNSNDPAMMNLALNNATNVSQYYHDLGERVSIEVVTFGPGLHMLRDDTSPVKPRIEVLAMSNPEISFKACGNTQENMRKAENKEIKIIPQATIVKSGIVHIMELQEQGWTYVKP